MKNYISIGLLSFFAAIAISCKSDDDSYTALKIETEADLIQVFQNASVEINVLENDSNLPSKGSLSAQSPQNGTVEILDPNNTPENPADDRILYTPNGSFTGEDVFQYTICGEGGNNCATDVVTVSVLQFSPVVFDIDEVPYQTLSEYNFFEGALAGLNPVNGVLPYEPINSLFSDYSLKKRFVWMPSGVKANYVSDHETLNFPKGTVLIKNFYYDNVQPENNRRIIETRLMIKKESGWVFANYVWNNAQTEANFDLLGSFTEVEWIQNGETKFVNYRIPPESECFTCHKSAVNSIPIGPKPQNLNSNYIYEDGDKNQLQKLIEMGYLENSLPSSINTVVNWDDPSQDLNMRMRAYVDTNCAHCHSDDRHCDYRPLRLEFKDSGEETNMGVCVTPDTAVPGYTKIVVPNDVGLSSLHFRMNTTLEEYRMPLLGRTLIHEEAISFVEEWINSLTTVCE